MNVHKMPSFVSDTGQVTGGVAQSKHMFCMLTAYCLLPQHNLQNRAMFCI